MNLPRRASFTRLQGSSDSIRHWASSTAARVSFASSIGWGGIGDRLAPSEMAQVSFDTLGLLPHYRGDSLLMHDGWDRRVTVFDQAGAVGRTFFIAPHPQYSIFNPPIVAFDNGNLLAFSRAKIMDRSGYGTIVDSSVFGLHDADGQPLAVVGRWPTGARMRFLREGVDTTLEAPFALEVDATMWKDGFCLGFGATFEIRCHDHAGQLRRIVRAPIAGQPVTPELVSRYEESQLRARPPAAQRAFRRILEDVTYPSALPVYRRLVGTVQGALWVEAYRPFGEGPSRWWWIDEAGRLAGLAEFPARFDAYVFDNGIVWGVWRDGFDVEHLRAYRTSWPDGLERFRLTGACTCRGANVSRGSVDLCAARHPETLNIRVPAGESPAGDAQRNSLGTRSAITVYFSMNDREIPMTPSQVVHSNPKILGGAPVFVSTRVPVRTLFEYLEGGDALDDFLNDFPSVSRDQAVAALEMGRTMIEAHAPAA